MSIEWELDKDAEPQGSSNGFWYDLTMGGYVDPKKVLTNASQLEELERAIKTVRSFEEAMEANELLIEF